MVDYFIRFRRKSRSIFTDGWVWRMAWRDARHNFSRLFLFAASLITGIAAVVALDSLNRSLQDDIDNQARELLGADLVIEGDYPYDTRLREGIDTLGLQEASQVSTASMVLFLHSQQSRLIRMVAMGGEFPFYGTIETLPAEAYDLMRQGGYAMLDETLASQYSVSSGDSLKLGEKVFKVAGVVRRIAGGGGLMSTFTPSVYIAMEDLKETNLVQFGSRVDYRYLYKIESDERVGEIVDALSDDFRGEGYSFETVARRKEGLGRGFGSIYQFFSLLAFVALILGCIGVASSVHIYAREKRDEVAVLRCIGSSGWQAFNIYFIQIFSIGLLGSVIGAFLGVAIQQVLPLFISNLIPFEMTFAVSWKSLVMGISIGAIVAVLFSMLPLVNVRFIPPLSVLRSDYTAKRVFSKTRLLAITLIAAFPTAFAAWQTRSLVIGALFFLGLVAALLVLLLVAMLLLWIVRRFLPNRAPFIWRHALSSLFRPNNQTQALMVSIGLGAFVISTLNIVEKSMLGQVEFTGRENQSNTVLFDIQPSQRDEVIKLIEENGLPVNQVVPIVTCRISELNGRSADELQGDTTDNVSNWAIRREYRVTYRDSLHHSEEMIDGEIHHLKNARDSVWVTISEGMLDNLDVKIGDSLVFDVQGVPIKAFISGVRKVDWPKDPPNFIFVFPSGLLEYAPQIFVVSTRVDDQEQANQFQRALVTDFPNVSLLDLRLILTTVNNLFDKLGLIVRFLALFSIVTGLIVLAGAVINSKFLRMRENILLRTIGARTRQITMITLIEHAWLGLFAAATGMVLSLGGGWLLMTFFFEITFAFDWKELLIITAGVVVLTMLIGWFNSRDVISTPPLQILRKET